MQPQQTPTKPVMDIALPPKSAAPAPVSEPSTGIPKKTASAMPVREAPHDPNASESKPDAAQQPEVPVSEKKPKLAGQSVTGIVVTTVITMLALASLTIVVYLKS